MKLDIESNKKGTGIRLIGPIVVRMPETGESIISEGVVAGAIQIPGDGQPIIILGETVTGGYRKIATVISADLPLLGQLRRNYYCTLSVQIVNLKNGKIRKANISDFKGNK